VIVGVIRRKPVLTHASIVCEGMLASVNSVNSVNSVKFSVSKHKHKHYIELVLRHHVSTNKQKGSIGRRINTSASLPNEMTYLH